MMILAFSIAVSGSITNSFAVGLSVYVNVYHNRIGSANLCVNSPNESLGCQNINLSLNPSPTQRLWQFDDGSVPVGGSFKVCITNNGNGQQTCKNGFNSPAKSPEYISITVPSPTSSNFAGGQPQSNTRAFNWLQMCNIVHTALYKSCNTYVTSYGTLTSEGDKAVGCIRNGLVLAGLGVYLNLPLGMIADILKGLATMFDCDNIVNMDMVKDLATAHGLADFGRLLNLLT